MEGPAVMSEIAEQETRTQLQDRPRSEVPLPYNTELSSFDDRQQEAVRVAESFYRNNPDWVKFFRKVLGANGMIAKLFSNEERARFESSAAYGEIQRMLAELRRKGGRPQEQETTRVITVRLPESIHEALKAEAELKHTSVNQLCISKLIQYIDADNVPRGS